MKQLTPQQHELVTSLARRLGAIPGIQAVVLGGSHARARAQASSNIDLYLFYSEAAPFASAELGTAVESVAQLFRETVALADGLYKPRFTLPK